MAHNIIDHIVETQFKQQCQTRLEQVCDTAVDVAIVKVPQVKCGTVNEQQCQTVFDTKLEEPPETGSVFWRYIETIMNRRIKS